MEEDCQNMNSSSYLGDEARNQPHFIVEADTNLQNNDYNHINPDNSQHVPLTVFGDRGTVPRSMTIMAQQQRQYVSSSSSLSCDDETEDEALVNLPFTPNPLPRVNSRESWSSSHRAPSSQNSSRDWGWFEDVYLTDRGGNLDVAAHEHGDKTKSKSSIDNGSSAMAVTAPTYVMEESLSSQLLWKESAGKRPPQPVEERAFYEKMWAQNFARSRVDYRVPVDVLTAASPISLNPFADGTSDSDHAYSTSAPQDTKGSDVAEAALVHRMNEEQLHNYISVNKEVKDSAGNGNLTVLLKGINVFGTTVSKSFARTNERGNPIASVDTITISIASYRVVESKKHGKYAQFLVVYREGSIRDTIGVWKRYSDFEELGHKVTQSHEGCAAAFANVSPLSVAEEPETEHLPNAITSWRLLKKRKRWYRCLDAGYLSLKVFLLERFLHDILFESSSPHLLREFVGVDPDML